MPGTVDKEILVDMALAKLPIIVVFNLCSIYCLSRYTLTRADHEQNAAVLAARRASEAEISQSVAARTTA